MESGDTVELGLQLGVSAALVLAMTVFHSLGLVAISRLLPLGAERLKERHFDARASWLLGCLGLLLFVLHIAEIWLFAVT